MGLLDSRQAISSPATAATVTQPGFPGEWRGCVSGIRGCVTSAPPEALPCSFREPAPDLDGSTEGLALFAVTSGGRTVGRLKVSMAGAASSPLPGWPPKTSRSGESIRLRDFLHNAASARGWSESITAAENRRPAVSKLDWLCRTSPWSRRRTRGQQISVNSGVLVRADSPQCGLEKHAFSSWILG